MKTNSSIVGKFPGALFTLAMVLGALTLVQPTYARHARLSPKATKAAIKVLKKTPNAIAQPHATLSEKIFNAGDISRGETINHNFIIKNDGKATLDILRVKPACGCTVAHFDRKITPGHTGIISIAVHTSAYRGPIHKTISVFTNDPALSNFQLAINATIKTVLAIKPRNTQEFGLVFKGQTLEKDFTITSTDGKPFLIKSVMAQDNHLKYKVHEAPDHLSATFKVTLPADHPAGPINGRFTLYTTHPKAQSIRLSVYGTIRNRLTVYPSDIIFSGINHAYVNKHPENINLDKTITLAYESSQVLTIEKVSSTLGNLTSKVATITPNKRYSIKLHLNPPLKVGTLKGTITIKTNRKDVVIPVRANIF